jgi:hypothetical protein
MRRCFVVLFLLFALRPAEAQSIPNCGAVTKDSQLWQAGYNLYLWATFETNAQFTGCPMQVQAEGWIVGAGDAVVNRAAFVVFAKKGQPIPRYGRWESFGKHWAILGTSWFFIGETHKQIDALPPPGAAPGGGSGECVDPEFRDDASRAGNGCDTPLILDMADDGYRLTSVRRGVTFDLDADGVPEQVAWTRAGSDDAWLALDRNGNGTIDNGSELFGNHTPAYADKAEPTAEHGFMALRFAEGPSYGPSRPDDRVDARDAVFSRLLVWTDRNHNGFSEPDELQKLSETPVAAISTDFRESRRRDRHGNQFRLRARSWWKDGSVHPVFDVWLLTRDIAPESDPESDTETDADNQP